MGWGSEWGWVGRLVWLKIAGTGLGFDSIWGHQCFKRTAMIVGLVGEWGVGSGEWGVVGRWWGVVGRGGEWWEWWGVVASGGALVGGACGGGGGCDAWN